jgi:hypothetical protein
MSGDVDVLLAQLKEQGLVADSIVAILPYLCLLLAGFLCGWWTRGAVNKGRCAPKKGEG